MGKTVRHLFNPEAGNVSKMFETHSGLLYWDEQLPAYYEVYRKLTGNFWIPQEVSLKTDISDWTNKMTDSQKELFKRGISQLVLLDSIASVFDAEIAAYIQNPAVKALINYISSQETIHNESYSYACTSIMTREEATEVFNAPKTDEKVISATNAILDSFDAFVSNKTPETAAKSLVAMAALEGIRFTNGFVPFYFLNRNNLMQGVGKIINFINRDEVQHSYAQLLTARDIVTQYSDVIDEKDFAQFTYDLFTEVVQTEQELSRSMFEDFPEMDMVELEMYVEWRANMLLRNLGLEEIFPTKRNPMRWINVYDPENINSTKTDFFENKVDNYQKTDEEKNGWGEL